MLSYHILALLLLPPLVHAAPRTAENAAWNVNMKQSGTDPADYEGAWPGHRYFPSPDDWRRLPVYQLITDRFADGDPTNNGIWPFQLTDFDVSTSAASSLFPSPRCAACALTSCSLRERSTARRFAT